MIVLIGMAGVGLLFIVFGLLSRLRGNHRCAGCVGGCASGGDGHPDHSPRRGTDETS